MTNVADDAELQCLHACGQSMHIFFFSSQFSSFQLVRCHGPPQIATVDACVCDFWFLWFATGMPLVVVLCVSGDVPLDSLFPPQRFCLFAGDSIILLKES